MKFQLAAAALLIAVIGALYVVTSDSNTPQQSQPAQTAPTSEEKAMSTLKIN